MTIPPLFRLSDLQIITMPTIIIETTIDATIVATNGTIFFFLQDPISHISVFPSKLK